MRGTGFDSGFTGAANDGSTRVEVVEAGFRFDASAKPIGADLEIAVAAGFGATLDAADGPLGIAKRVNAPDLAGLPERVEEPLVRVSLPGETTALRTQVAADPGFDGIISAQRLAPGVELRSRRIDVQGLEGFDASRSFVLKARPEPLACLQPRSDSKQAVGSIAFNWAPNIEASQVRIQVADAVAFTNLLQDHVAAASLAVAALTNQDWRDVARFI